MCVRVCVHVGVNKLLCVLEEALGLAALSLCLCALCGLLGRRGEEEGGEREGALTPAE